MILISAKADNTPKGYFLPVKRLNHKDLTRRAVALPEYEAIQRYSKLLDTRTAALGRHLSSLLKQTVNYNGDEDVTQSVRHRQ